jgi:uncharacterized protein YegP (UPF0339 family)
MTFVTYADNAGHFHWRLDGDDGKPVATSAISYTSESAARKAATHVHDNAGTAGGT